VVWLTDRSEEALAQAETQQAQELDRRIEAEQITADEKPRTMARIHFTTDLKEGASRADLVIEAVPERLDLKREVFGQLDHICPSHTILATNSSSIRISAIEDATCRRDRVLNLHFYPPVWQRPMVELMCGTET
jgi:3-hydroxybutyryl-CoA dehydrogenase